MPNAETLFAHLKRTGQELRTRAGSKRWFWKIYADGKESRMALDSYPTVTLTAARKARDAAKLQKSDGTDPVQARKIAKLKESALEWFEKQKGQWSEHHAIREHRNLEKDLFPFFAARPIGKIEPIELLAVIQKVEERGAFNVSHRVLSTARAVWRYAVATARAPRDITGDIASALIPHRKKNFAAIRAGQLSGQRYSLHRCCFNDPANYGRHPGQSLIWMRRSEVDRRMRAIRVLPDAWDDCRYWQGQCRLWSYALLSSSARFLLSQWACVSRC